MHNDSAPLSVSIPAMAQLRGLTKLHLSLADSNPAVDFQPLSQICELEDLALQCSSSPASCSDVLLSCRLTLRLVSLAACRWDSATYAALGQVPSLDKLVIRLWSFDTEQAQGLPYLSAETTKLEVYHFGLIPDAALLAWSAVSRSIQVDELTLWAVNDLNIGLLGSMPCIRKLHIVQSPHFAGRTLQRHLNVNELKLISCPDIDGPGMQHMLTAALPGVKTLAFQSSIKDDPAFLLHLDLDALKAVTCAKRLNSVDLRGVQGLTRAEVTQLQSHFALTPEFGRSPPFVLVHLPSDSLGQHQPIMDVCTSLHVPVLHFVKGHDKSRRVGMRLNQQRLRDDLCTAAVQLSVVAIISNFVTAY